LKFRGIKQTTKNLKKETEAVLTSYVATEEIVGELFEIPQMSFAFSYLASTAYYPQIFSQRKISKL
jgi:hypothetical protein